MKTSLKRQISLGMIATVIVGAIPSYSFGNVSIGIVSPGGGTTWQANANLAVQGSINWDKTDTRPTGAIVYIHAGGPIGPVTNSVLAAVSNIEQPNGNAEGSEDFSATLTLIPSSPPIGGPNGVATYFVEADAVLKLAVEAYQTMPILVKKG